MADPVIPEQLLLSSDHTDGVVVVVVLVPMSHHQLLMKLPSLISVLSAYLSGCMLFSQWGSPKLQ
jgi:hypothetical protein